MFWNIYWKRILWFVRNTETIIWTWIFPLMLATLFYAVFTNIDASGQFSRMPVGVVDNGAYRQDAAFRAALESVSGEGDGSLFDLRLLPSQGEADTLLEKGEIDGYILVEDVPVLIVSGSGLRQTITKSFIDRYLQTKGAVEAVILRGGDFESVSAFLEPVDYTEEISLSQNPPTEKVGYFYALLAMVCLYGGFQGMMTVMGLQANLSPLGARRTMAPVGRFRMVAYDMLGGVTTQYMCLLVIVAYINFVLGVSFGPKLWLVLLTCLAGSLLGVAFGAMISVTSKLKEQAKIAVLITVTMVCCFLSGLMVSGINYTVVQNAPAVAWLNPAARIADAFYCLYYYDTYERFFLNIGIIMAMTTAMLAVTAVFVRRQRYESI